MVSLYSNKTVTKTVDLTLHQFWGCNLSSPVHYLHHYGLVICSWVGDAYLSMIIKPWLLFDDDDDVKNLTKKIFTFRSSLTLEDRSAKLRLASTLQAMAAQIERTVKWCLHYSIPWISLPPGFRNTPRILTIWEIDSLCQASQSTLLQLKQTPTYLFTMQHGSWVSSTWLQARHCHFQILPVSSSPLTINLALVATSKDLMHA